MLNEYLFSGERFLSIDESQTNLGEANTICNDNKYLFEFREEHKSESTKVIQGLLWPARNPYLSA